MTSILGEGGGTPRVDDPPRIEVSGEARLLGYAGKASLVASEKPGPRYLSNSLPSPCRLCGGPTWLADDEGGIHPCCELSWDGNRCVACDASEALNRSHRNRNSRPWKDAKGVD